jgi:hypothetical protein
MVACQNVSYPGGKVMNGAISLSKRPSNGYSNPNCSIGKQLCIWSKLDCCLIFGNWTFAKLLYMSLRFGMLLESPKLEGVAECSTISIVFKDCSTLYNILTCTSLFYFFHHIQATKTELKILGAKDIFQT